MPEFAALALLALVAVAVALALGFAVAAWWLRPQRSSAGGTVGPGLDAAGSIDSQSITSMSRITPTKR